MGRSDALSRRFRQVPTWFSDAKLGVFIHWVPASVPGFAPTEHDIRDRITSGEANPIGNTPYSEWYENSLRFPDSSVSEYHRRTYGNRPYREFAGDFVAGLHRWDPADWAKRFASMGARYVVLVSKHHDGFCLWPTSVRNPHVPDWCTERDVVGEMAAAVRSAGMRFGVYYSGGYDWTFDNRPIGTLADGLFAVPRGDYIEYAEQQVTELIDLYRPSVLWNDIAWPSSQRRLNRLFEYYFDRVPDGVVNDRWMTGTDLSALLDHRPVRGAINAIATRSIRSRGLVPPKPKFFQFRTPEFTNVPDIDHRPWEATRGMDHGFGFNRQSVESDFMSHHEIVRSVLDTVSKGGNLLLNVGPRGEDAAIPEAQSQRLEWLDEAMNLVGDGVFGTRPWVTPHMAVHPGLDLFFTASCETVNVIGLIDLVDLDGSCDDPSSDAGSVLEAIAVDVPLVVGPSSIVSTPNRGFSAATSAFDAKPDELRIEVGPESTRLFIVPERFGEIALFLASFTFVHAGPGVATSKQPRPKRGR